MRTLKVLLVDDQPTVRRGLRMRLGLEPDLVVVGEAGDGESAIAIARELQPDVILMDLLMPGMDGLSATAALSEAGLPAAVVIVTICDDDLTRARARAAGAAAFLDKYSFDDELIATIRAAGEAGEEGPPPEGPPPLSLPSRGRVGGAAQAA